MAGLGRRTHYRKHLTDSIIYDFPEPDKHECIAKVVATRGGNQFDIILPTKEEKDGTHNDADNKKQHEHESQLAILPTKFNKLVWVKRNDFVIVETVKDNETDQDDKKGDSEPMPTTTNIHDGIRFMISHILYKDQVKHLQSKGLWPNHDKEFVAGGVRSLEESTKGDSAEVDSGIAEKAGEDADDVVTEADDGIVYDMSYEMDDEYFVNTNRLANLKVDDSSSDESDSEDK